MKLFKYSVLALALAAGFASCSDDETYVAGAASDGVYFPTTDSADVELDRTKDYFEVEVSRLGETAAASYGITGTADDEVFSLPSSISFAQGETTAKLVIPYIADNMAMDRAYTVILGFAEGTTVSSYGYESLELSVVLPAPWTTIGKGTFCDLWVLPFYGITPEKYPELTNTWEVELQRNDVDPLRYRWRSPYGENFAKYCASNDIVELDENEYDAAGKYNIEFVTDKDGNAVVPYNQLTGATISEEDGMVIAGTLGGFYYSQGNSISAILNQDPSWVSKFDAKEEYESFTTPAGSIIGDFSNDGSGPYLPSYNPGGYIWWAEKVEVMDYDITLAYNGILTDPESDTYVQLSVKLGADVAKAAVALVPGEDVEAAVEAVLAGEVETETITESTAGHSFYIFQGGEYVAVAVGYNQDGDQVSVATLEIFAVTTAEPKEWRKLGTGVMVDGWYIGRYSMGNVRIDPMQRAYDVAMEENIENPGVYRIIAPWTTSQALLSQVNNYTGDPVNLIIDARDVNKVSILPQFSGYASIDEEGSEYFWSSTMGDVLAAYGYTQEEIIAENCENYLENGEIVIMGPSFGVTASATAAAPDILDCAYTFYATNAYSDELEYCPGIFALPGATASAPAKVAIKRIASNAQLDCTNKVFRQAVKFMRKKSAKGRNFKDYSRKCNRIR